ncbi:MAG TPA: hypothetical protein VN837_09515 [Chloroflexota bacterium]|nr:hypothetical protein [Chloroflexota bacterium]
MNILLWLIRGRRRPRGVLGTIVAVVVGLIILGSVASALVAHFAGLQVSNVFTTDKAAYDAWNPSSSSPPSSKIDVFPHGTMGIAVYYEVTGATAKKTKIQAKLFDGATQVSSFNPDTMSSDSAAMLTYLDPGQTLSPGSYHVELDVNGKQMGTHAFTVK